jgi:type I restriction enzyme S subunit
MNKLFSIIGILTYFLSVVASTLDSFVSTHYTVLPNKAVAKKFYNVANEIEIKKQKNLKENQKLVDLRDWLLPMLMNGQVKVN